MPSYSSNRRSISPLTLLAIFLAVLVLGVGGTVLGLVAAGMIKLPSTIQAEREPSREGWVLVPMSGRAIPAYNMVQRDDLGDPKTGLWKEDWIPRGALPEDVLTSRSKIIGRVMSHEKAPGYVFTESDFMPVGTRNGRVAGIPPGKRSLTVEAAKLAGIHGLQMGDRFDLVSTLAPDRNRPASPDGPIGMPPPKPEVKVLVNNGMIVTPVHTRSMFGPNPPPGARSNAKPVEEVVIALEPTEVAELTAAMSLAATVTVVARSGHPDDAKQETTTSGSPPPPPVTLIETVQGPKRQTLAFPEKTDEVPESPARALSDQPPPAVRKESRALPAGNLRLGKHGFPARMASTPAVNDDGQ